MSRARYIGDEAHAAAWRLAGIEVRVADAGSDVGELLCAACREVDLVLIAQASAARVPAALLDQAGRALTPLLLVLPGPDTLASDSKLALTVRAQLGMES